MNPRLRRVATRVPFGRAYEVEIPWGEGVECVVTRSPLSVLDPLLGVGDAWSLIDAANRAWDGQRGEWVALFEPGQGS